MSKNPVVIIGIVLMWLSTAAHGSAADQQHNAAFMRWLEGFRAQALERGHSARLLERAFDGLTAPLPEIARRDTRQLETILDYWGYMRLFVTDQRIETARAHYQTHLPLLKKIGAQWGVAPEYFVAFWGVETNFGAVMGSSPTVAAVASLAYLPRRRQFFTGELFALLRLLEREGWSPETLRSSWAGAMGNMQFIPSTYLHYGYDGDGDGRVDLWTSLEDSFHSAGHYLKAIGWRAGESWGEPVQLPPDFPGLTPKLRQQHSMAFWHKLGLRKADGSALQASSAQARLLAPVGFAGPAFLVHNNFKVITRWNRSQLYALAIGILADRIVGTTTARIRPPEGYKPLTSAVVRRLQDRLKAQGLNPGVTDGRLGARTRKALRQYQRRQRLPIDGWPDSAVLAALGIEAP